MRRPAVALVACLVLAGCAARTDAQTEVAVHAPLPSSTSSPAPTTQDNRQVDDAQPLAGPKTAEVGVAYPFDLYTHCGVRFAGFAGQTWLVAQPVADPAGEPFARGAINYLPGTAILADPSTLRFTVSAAAWAIPGEVVTFHPTTEPMPRCQ